MSPNELALAENGNFFIRSRVRQVLELLAPGQCTFFETCNAGSSQTTTWFLAVPNHQVIAAKVDPRIPRCNACSEPRSAHPGTQWVEYYFGTPHRGQRKGAGWTEDSQFDVLKSATWASSEKGWDKWIARELHLSVRLLHLFKRIDAKGFRFYESDSPKPIPATAEELSWIDEKLVAIEAAGIALHAEGAISKSDAKWYAEYLKNNANKKKLGIDVKAVEKRLKTKLPKSYLEFIEQIGTATFESVDEHEGFTAKILAPSKLRIEAVEEARSSKTKVLTFADTLHGDMFCFELEGGKREPVVLYYNHEIDLLEPYADNFVACIQRFAAAGG